MLASGEAGALELARNDTIIIQDSYKNRSIGMEISSAFNSAVTGIQRGLDGLDRNTDKIAKSSNGQGGDVVEPLVESRINQLQVEANTKMVKTLDETIGSLLDEMA
jgi:hypothetical protein